MMTDTSTEAVERLCRDIHDGITCGEILPVDGVNIQDTLRALAAERDALKGELHEARMQAIVDFGKLQEVCEERDALKEALALMVYETTHLSPIEEDGSHWCRITGPCLAKARAALQENTDD